MHCRAGWGLGEWTEAAGPALLPVELPLWWGWCPVPGLYGPWLPHGEKEGSEGLGGF